MTRRSFAGALALGGALQGQETRSGAAVSITAHLDKHVATVPHNYSGFSYEAAQFAHPEFFAPTNKSLIAFFRRLSKQGVLRTGGNSSEFTLWSPAGTAAGPDTGGRKTGGARARTPVTPEAIRNLAGFLDATGWQLIYGFNLGTGSPEQAAQEAKAVSDVAGRRLIAFQIGNEPDLYHRNRPNDLRLADWGFANYLSQWREFSKAVRKTVPKAVFGAPDIANVAGNMEWVVQFGEQAANEIGLLSGHYYAEGPPEDARTTIERLLNPDPRLLKCTPRTMEVSRATHHPFRMTEGNSCYNGGKRGVSDTFASALWAADYTVYLAQSGYAGVNFHGGGNGIYTPIAGSIASGFSARPLYYGLLLGDQFAGATMVETRVDSNGINATAYAAKVGSGVRIAIFNKDERQAIHATLSTGARAHKATLWRLNAPSVESTTGVRLAGAEVSADGAWAPQQEEPVQVASGQYAVDLPAASGALVFLS
jgi:hypothetical protein